MRRTTLLTQVLLVNLLLIAAAVVAATVASSPVSDLRDTGAAGLVLGFALAVTIAVNVFLLSRRFEPLERLADQMERANLAGPTTDEPDIGGPEEVRRLEQSFRRMLRRLEAERRRSGSEALEAQERERARVARDLHDEVNQALTALVLRIEAVRTKAPPELRAELEETRAVAGQAMDELLALARQLRPTALDDLGLIAALSGLADDIRRQGGVDATFDSDGSAEAFAELPDEVQLVIYRIAQEGMSNAIRHARATQIRVRLAMSGPDLELEVRDDGVGFDAEATATGLGIAGMRERALLVGGRLTIESHPGQGARVTLKLTDADTKAAEPRGDRDAEE